MRSRWAQPTKTKSAPRSCCRSIPDRPIRRATRPPRSRRSQAAPVAPISIARPRRPCHGRPPAGSVSRRRSRRRRRRRNRSRRDVLPNGSLLTQRSLRGVRELARRRVALRRILRHRPLDDRVESRRQARHGLGERRRVRIHVRPQRRELVLAPVRGPAGEGLEQDAAERVDVGARSDRHSLDLLRCRVVDRAHPRAGARQPADRAGVLRQAEVGQIYVVLAGQQDVGRLDVAMDQVALVRSVKGTCNLTDEMHRARGRQRSAVDGLAQVRSLHPAHRDVESAVGLARLVHRDDVRVIDRRGDHPLAPEPLPKSGVARKRRGHQL